MYPRTVCKLACAVALIISTAGVKPALSQSAEVCDGYAHNYAKNASRHGQILGGGAIGSLVGLGIGAAFGGAAVGAAIGGGLGLIGGGHRRNQRAAQMYQAAYSDCMAGRVQ